MCSKAVCDVTKGTDPQLCVGSALSHQHPHCVEGPTDSLFYQEAVNRGLNMTFSGNVGRFFLGDLSYQAPSLESDAQKKVEICKNMKP